MEKPSFSYWSIAALGLVWSLMGCLSYITQNNADFVTQLAEPQRSFITQRPFWASAAFAVAVYGGAVGCILLLLRRVAAVQALGLSLMGALLTLFYMVMTLGLSVGVLQSAGVSVLVGCVLLWISMAARVRGWLR